MDFWQRARNFAEEAAKRSQELTKEAAKKSQDHITMIGSSSARLSDIVSEASRKSKEIAAEASKRADQIKAEALKRADLIKSQIPTSAAALSSLVVDVSSTEAAAAAVEDGDLERFGVTEELREFVKGITLNTFRDFPLEGILIAFSLDFDFCFFLSAKKM